MAASSSDMVLRSTRPQVFINFRGEELRRGFISFLEPTLKNENINVFIDELELRGRDLQNLFVRIKESKIALVIFSKDYANSEWCLDELAMIKECMDQGNLDVIPIFYKVEPSVVKYLLGYLGENFMNLKNRYENDPERTRKWEEALASVSQKFGLPFPEKSLSLDRINNILGHPTRDVPAKVQLMVPYSNELQERELQFVDLIRNEWVDIQAGVFVAQPQNLKIAFYLYQHKSNEAKTGLLVKGAVIRPVE